MIELAGDAECYDRTDARLGGVDTRNTSVRYQLRIGAWSTRPLRASMRNNVGKDKEACWMFMIRSREACEFPRRNLCVMYCEHTEMFFADIGRDDLSRQAIHRRSRM